MDDYHGRVIQGGQPVASVSAPTRERMLTELYHYAWIYGRDDTVMLETRSGKSSWRRQKI